MLPINKKISRFNHYKGGNKKLYIVLHDVGALGQAKVNVDYFASQNRGASAHYFVDTTSIWQSVEDNDRAWHVGDDKPNDSHDVGDLINNHNTIGIEMCLNGNWKIEESTKIHTIELVKYLQKKYNIPNSRIVRHYDASGKICPRSMSGNNWAEYKALYNRITGSQAASNPIHINTPNSHIVVKNDTLWGLSKQYDITVSELKAWNNLKSDTITIGQKLAFKKATKPVLAPAQKPAKLSVDGYLGIETIKELQRYFGTPVDGILSSPSLVIKKLQKLIGTKVDGYMGVNTIRALQRYLKTPVDGKLDKPSMVIKALQTRLNNGQL